MCKPQLKEKRFLCRFFDPVLFEAYANSDDFIDYVFWSDSLEELIDRVLAFAKPLGLVPFDICEVVYEFDLEDM